MYNLKEMVKDGKDGKKVNFKFYKLNELWYETETGFQFPVPISDTGDGVFLAQDKVSFFMRYIRKHIKMLEDAQKEHDRPTLKQLKELTIANKSF